MAPARPVSHYVTHQTNEYSCSFGALLLLLRHADNCPALLASPPHGQVTIGVRRGKSQQCGLSPREQETDCFTAPIPGMCVLIDCLAQSIDGTEMALQERLQDTGITRQDSGEAWFIVAAAFIAGFVVFGITYCFGAFLEPMAADLHSGRGATSALFSITGVAFYMLGPFTGRLSDRFGPRVMVGFGAVIMGGGLALTAYIDRIWIGYFTYGIGVGAVRCL